jgi:hypothetical protein
VVDTGKHDLGVLLHHDFALKLFFSRNVSKDENYAAALRGLVSLDPYVEVGAAHIGAVFILDQLSLFLLLHGLILFTITVVFLVADSLKALVHVQQHSLIRS